MNPFFRRFLPVLATVLALAVEARAERIFPVNSIFGGKVFDQPSVASNGNTIHVAFVGTNAGNTDITLYYAAVNGAADFTSNSTTDNQVLVIRAVAIDNGLYTQARHPQIAVRAAGQLVVLFQAVPAGGTESKLFRALISLGNNAVTRQTVEEVRDPSGLPMAGALSDPSFGLVTTDNTLRVAYADNTAHVLYARVGIDNALLAGTPILLNPQEASRGVRPLPRLRLDSLNRSHIAWAANNNSGAASGVYYALVKQGTGGIDNLAIGATQVLAGGYRWGFPNVLVQANSRILILAADEPYGPFDTTGIAGSLGVSLLNPDGVTQNGEPVTSLNVGSNASFFLFPPGQSVLGTNFDAYRPEAALDSSNRLYVAGYGTLASESPLVGTPGRFYAMSVSGVTTGSGSTAEISQMASAPLPVGNAELAFAGSLPGDYTRPAFTRYSGKTVLFWSGPAITGGRNLYVTSVPSVADTPTATTQSGCSVVGDPRRGEAGRTPGAAVLFLPAALLALRRFARKAFAR
ncbi:MAG TPA: hypothetical protein VF853_03775 [Candidatus Deferrimicrobiaceae bacterium]